MSKKLSLSFFTTLKKSGRKIAGKFYLLVFLPSEKKEFAVIASRRVGKAVKRNYEKRLMRLLIQEKINQISGIRFLLIRLPKREGAFSEKQQDFSKILYRFSKTGLEI